jgi:hypothetical protein
MYILSYCIAMNILKRIYASTSVLLVTVTVPVNQEERQQKKKKKTQINKKEPRLKLPKTNKLKLLLNKAGAKWS